MRFLPSVAFDRRRVLRIALSHYVTSGLSAAFGLLLVSVGVDQALGPVAAGAASVGAIVCIPPDQTAPQRGKLLRLLPAAVIGLPLFFAVQALHAAPLRLGLLLVPASFLAFLAGAWGKRGLPLSVSIMFALIFSMAVPPNTQEDTVLATSLHFALGAGLYLVYAVVANSALNARYRVQLLADTLAILAGVMRTQARQFVPETAPADEEARARPGAAPLVGRLLLQQAALADDLQSARDLLLEAPHTLRRQQLAGMLIQVLELRDRLLACGLDLELLQAHPGPLPMLEALRDALEDLADAVERIGDDLLLGRVPQRLPSRAAALAALHWDVGTASASTPSPAPDATDLLPPPLPSGTPPATVLARGLAARVAEIDDATVHLAALARGEAEPDLAAVRTAWQLFVSPTSWSWRPLRALWRHDAPPLRHAVRAALAIGCAYVLSLALPWGTHDYWILLTITVVLRGSLAQTLERRNSRTAGTLLGCLLSAALLAAHPGPVVLLTVLTLAQAVAHAFAIRLYLVTAIAATVLGLLQAHQLNVGGSPVFAAAERIADTLLGVGIAWAFSYVLPSWERSQIPSLVKRTLAAQARHARVALGLGQLQAVDNEPEIEWRLARREAYDSISALVQATQRSLVEPRAVRPPLARLQRLLAHSYQLLAQLTAVKTMLLSRRQRLDAAGLSAPLLQAAGEIEAVLAAGAASASATATAPATATAIATAPPDTPQNAAADAAAPLSDPFVSDLGPWVLRRLDLACATALRLRDEADRVLRASLAARG